MKPNLPATLENVDTYWRQYWRTTNMSEYRNQYETNSDGDIPKEKWEECDRCLIKIRPPGLADHRCGSCGRCV